MKEGQYSRTAAGAAALRANHFLFTKNPVFMLRQAAKWCWIIRFIIKSYKALNVWG